MSNEVKWTKLLKFSPQIGANALQASRENVNFTLVKDGNTVKANLDGYGLENDATREVDALLASIVDGGPDVLAARQQFGASIAEPIQQIIPYVEQYDRFFMQQTIGEIEDNLIGVEDLVNVAYESHMASGIKYNQPGYRFVRPTFTYFQTGFRIQWQTMRKAGWNLLARQMNYVAWELARKRDAAAKVVLDAAIPTSHKLTVTGGLTKAAVDQVIRQSNQVGFPVKFAVINPGRLMEMQGWTWGGTGFFTPPNVAQELIDNLYYGNYGGVTWYAHPYAPVNTVYFGGDATQIGWHQTKGSPRNDTAVDITTGEDLYSMRDAQHSWYVGSGLSLYTIQIA